MRQNYTSNRDGLSSGNRRRSHAYSADSRRPVSRSTRDRRQTRRNDRERISREAQRYSLKDDGHENEYQRYSRDTEETRHAAHRKAQRYSTGDGRYTQPARKRRKRRRIRNIVVTSLAVILVAGVAVAGGFLSKINGNLNAGISSSLLSMLTGNNVTTEPSYFLLLGTDESKARDNNASYGGSFRADSIILARVDPTTKEVSLVSIPRDTKVDLGGDYGVQKINAASTYGGSTLAVQAVETVTGIDINHYVEVNFDGFKDIVDALGGIEVNVPVTIKDSKAGGTVKKGKQTLNGKQALILCRSRHAYDSQGSGDKYRSANQRLVLTAIAKKLLSSDPATMASVVSKMSESVTTDLSSTDILSLAQSFSDFDADNNMYTAELPTKSVYEDNLWYEEVIEDEWEQMKARLEAGESPAESDEVDEATGTVLATAGGSSDSSDSSESSYSGTVSVKNGTTTSGLASKAASTIGDMGFTCSTGNADSSDYTTTVVVYGDSSQKDTAQAIVDKIGTGKAVQNDGDYLFTTDYLVVVGSDYSG
ncbi:MAG: LCP family protein [Eggerthellaceae bacterium]|jgi:LCP family protein required for cell wall assembly